MVSTLINHKRVSAVPLARKGQQQHTHTPATHTLRSLCVRVSCFLRATVCNVHLIPTAAWRDTASGRKNLRPE